MSRRKFKSFIEFNLIDIQIFIGKLPYFKSAFIVHT